MTKKRQKLEVGDKVMYPVTGTKGKIVEIKKIGKKKWALIKPIYVWIEVTKLVKISETKQENPAHQS